MTNLFPILTYYETANLIDNKRYHIGQRPFLLISRREKIIIFVYENSADEIWLAGGGCFSRGGAGDNGYPAAGRNLDFIGVGCCFDGIAFGGRFYMAFGIFQRPLPLLSHG
jgi:hypothetical protein